MSTAVQCDPEALRQLAARTRALVAERTEACVALNHELSTMLATWTDARARVTEVIVGGLLHKATSALSGIEAQARFADRLADHLDRYLGEASGAANSALVATAEAAASSRSYRSKDGREQLVVFDVRGLSVEDFDWVDPEFVATFETKKWHTFDAANYHMLARGLPAVLQAMDQGIDPATLSSQEARSSYDAFFGGEPIKLDRPPSGRIGVTNGRHRLLACLLAGVSPPVLSH